MQSELTVHMTESYTIRITGPDLLGIIQAAGHIAGDRKATFGHDVVQAHFIAPDHGGGLELTFKSTREVPEEWRT